MRDIADIDHEIELERIIWNHERRHPTSDDCQAAARRIDRLLEERTDVVSTMPNPAPRPVDARLVRPEG